MNFACNEDLCMFLSKLSYLSEGTQGKCFLDKKNNKVIKLFWSFFEGENSYINKDEILRFSNLKNDTVIWPEEVIVVNGIVQGYVIDYVNVVDLFKVNPLNVDLDDFAKAILKAEEDIKFLTNNNVKMYDVTRNTLFNGKQLYIIDTLEYDYGKTTFEKNREGLDLEIKYFLVDGYFNWFVERNADLLDLYRRKENSGYEFLCAFREELRNYLKEDINTLGTAQALTRKRNIIKYNRDF